MGIDRLIKLNKPRSRLLKSVFGGDEVVSDGEFTKSNYVPFPFYPTQEVNTLLQTNKTIKIKTQIVHPQAVA